MSDAHLRPAQVKRQLRMRRIGFDVPCNQVTSGMILADIQHTVAEFNQ